MDKLGSVRQALTKATKGKTINISQLKKTPSALSQKKDVKITSPASRVEGKTTVKDTKTPLVKSLDRKAQRMQKIALIKKRRAERLSKK